MPVLLWSSAYIVFFCKLFCECFCDSDGRLVVLPKRATPGTVKNRKARAEQRCFDCFLKRQSRNCFGLFPGHLVILFLEEEYHEEVFMFNFSIKYSWRCIGQ